ncbi:hypothetical protein BH10PLA2_BH10PLA2_12260 [soil metagenome]
MVEVEAALAYNAFIKAYCPEFGYLNPIPGAKADEEPTATTPPPKKRRSRIVELSISEKRLRRMRSQMKRAGKTAARRNKILREKLGGRKEWQPPESISEIWNLLVERGQSTNEKISANMGVARN